MSALYPSQCLSGRLNILVAFPYATADVLAVLRENRDRINLIIDSGAFTAWNTGKDIRLDDYCKFLDSIQDLRPFHAVQLDVFGDPEASAANYNIMRSRGYDVMPVFTRGETADKLDELYEHTDYIMFGGIVIGGSNRNYIKWFVETNKGRKAHWLGFVKMPFILKYKPESVDSSAWAQDSARFGKLFYFDAKTAECSWHKRTEFASAPSRQLVSGFRSMGVPTDAIRLLGRQESWPVSGTIPAWVQSHKYIAEAGSAHILSILGHIRRSLWTQATVGTKIYLAVGIGASHPRFVLAAYNYGLSIGAWTKD